MVLLLCIILTKPLFFCFFFQAEDGIRDLYVTGFRRVLFRSKLGGGEEGLLAWEFSAGLEDWEHAPAPAQIGKRIVEGVFQRQLPPQRAALTNNLIHWGYGIAWGGLFGLVEGSLRSRKVGHGLVLGATVWTTGYIVLPLARLYRPIWEYDAKVLAKDLGDQLVYGVSAAAADGLLSGR